MLAYVFWHIPAAHVSRDAYEQALRNFHQHLAAAAVPGFIRSEAHRLESVPWLSGSPAYEDWYLIADSAALDPLEAAAVGARMGPSHDAVAAMAAAGAGGLYTSVLVGAESGPETAAEWFGKPAGAAYPAFIEGLRGHVVPGGWLWQRKMVLGPSPEFCILHPPGERRAGRSQPLTRSRVFPDPR